jgi:hypothetical protein
MKKLKVTWKGMTPLIMHSNQGVNPLHPITKEMKKYTGKRKKTDEDYEIIADLEWESGLYWKDEIGTFMPAENVEATIRNGAKSIKKGSAIQKFLSVEPLYIPFTYGEKLSKEQLKADLKYRDVRVMKINNSSILRTRPRFDTWQIQFFINYEEKQMDLEDIVQSIDYAGKFVGLCDSRPKYGQFVAIIEEVE